MHFYCFFITHKQISPDYYRDIVGLPDIEVVKRNIAYFAEKLHVEVTTPIAQGVNDTEMTDIAKFLSGIDREMPWHIFRLIPEHKMADASPPDVNELGRKVLKVRKILPYTYFSNFIGSVLDNTMCPECGEKVIERLCVKSCGATLTDYRLTDDNECPVCGAKIRITGSVDETVRRRA